MPESFASFSFKFFFNILKEFFNWEIKTKKRLRKVQNIVQVHYPVPESLASLAWGQAGRLLSAIFLGMFRFCPPHSYFYKKHSQLRGGGDSWGSELDELLLGHLHRPASCLSSYRQGDSNHWNFIFYLILVSQVTYNRMEHDRMGEIPKWESVSQAQCTVLAVLMQSLVKASYSTCLRSIVVLGKCQANRWIQPKYIDSSCGLQPLLWKQ